MDMRKLIGRNVRRIRLERGLTQEQFAERSGFTQQYLSGLERGERNPTIVTLYELALAFETDHVSLVLPDSEAVEEERRCPRPTPKERARRTTKPAPRRARRG